MCQETYFLYRQNYVKIFIDNGRNHKKLLVPKYVNFFEHVKNFLSIGLIQDSF